jgi:hypothetical protein
LSPAAAFAKGSAAFGGRSRGGATTLHIAGNYFWTLPPGSTLEEPEDIGFYMIFCQDFADDRLPMAKAQH